MSIQLDNTTPTFIGILCIDIAKKLQEYSGNSIKSYIAAQYVHFVENVGARSVPVWINKERSYYEKIMSQINGILIPGGAVYFDSKYINDPNLRNDCVESTRHIFEIALEKNSRGEYFPLWGTCLGYELLMYHSAGDVDPRQDCKPMNCSMPIVLEKDFRDTKMFQFLSGQGETLLTTLPCAHHKHKYCITKADLEQFKINKYWRVLATAKDTNGLEFISIVEHKKYPIYGCQFHPEWVPYEHTWNINTHPQVSDCVQAAEYFAHFFVSQCLKNQNKFETFDEALRHTTSNFQLHRTGIDILTWKECYLFQENIEYPE